MADRNAARDGPKCGKQALHNQFIGFCCNHVFLAFRGVGQTDEGSGQTILQVGRFSSFAAYAIAGAARSTGSLFALKAEHIGCHVVIPLFCFLQRELHLYYKKRLCNGLLVF